MDEVRLIDADLLKTNIAQIAKYCARSDKQKALVGRILFMIDNMPTIYAGPIKHGQWIEKKLSRMKWIPDESDGITAEETTIEDMTEQKCSICQRWAIKFTHHIEMNYCPNCGARMDVDKSD